MELPSNTEPTLTHEQQLALSDIGAHAEWTPEQVELATTEISAIGQAEIGHMNEQEAKASDEVKRGLALAALTPEQQLSLDSLAASGADQDRVDAARDQMINS